MKRHHLHTYQVQATKKEELNAPRWKYGTCLSVEPHIGVKKAGWWLAALSVDLSLETVFVFDFSSKVIPSTRRK